jgi:hypothetical protein
MSAMNSIEMPPKFAALKSDESTVSWAPVNEVLFQVAKQNAS